MACCELWGFCRYCQNCFGLPYTISTERYETLQQQCICFLVAYHPSSCVARILTSNQVFYVQFNSEHQRKFHGVAHKWLPDKYFQNLLPSIICIKGSIWTTSAAINTFPCSISPPFPCGEATLNLVFCVQIEGQPQQKWHDMNHKELQDAVRRSFHLPHTSKEDYKILQQQWLCLLVAPHPISSVESVFQI